MNAQLLISVRLTTEILKAVHTARLCGVCPSVCLPLSYSRGLHTAVNYLLLLVNDNCTVETICKYLFTYKVQLLTEVQLSVGQSNDGISCLHTP